MRTGVFLLAFIATAFAVDKPGKCPAELQEANSTSVVTPEQTCVTDLDCMGTDKCCGQMCVAPVCDPDVVPAQCLVSPCNLAICSSIMEAVCFQDPCSDSCGFVWLTEDRDVTDECIDDDIDEDDEFDDDIDNDDIDDDDIDDEDEDEDERGLTWKEKKERRKARKQGLFKKIAARRAKKLQAIEQKRAKKIAKWDKKGKQDKIERFQEKWANKDASLQEKLEALRSKKMAKKQKRKQAKQERKQMKKDMSPEELEAYKAERRAKWQAKKEAKLERKEEMKGQLMGKRKSFKQHKMEKKRLRKQRRQGRKMMVDSA